MSTPSLFGNVRDRIQDGFLYTIKQVDGSELFGGSKVVREYYDKMIAAGDSGEDIIETIYQHRDDGAYKLSERENIIN